MSSEVELLRIELEQEKELNEQCRFVISKIETELHDAKQYIGLKHAEVKALEALIRELDNGK